MKKIIFFLLVVLFALSIPALFKFSKNKVSDYSHLAARNLEGKEYLSKIKIHTLDFKKAELSSLNTISWQGIFSQIGLKRKNDFLSGQNFTISLKNLELKIISLLKGKCMLNADGLTIAPSIKSESDRVINANAPQTLENGKLNITFEFNFFQPQTTRTQIKNLYEEIAEILRTGKTVIPINFSGISYFSISKKTVKAMITTFHDGEGYYHLVVNKEFFKSIAWLMADNLTDAEATLLSVNPIRLPKLLNIMNDAKRESERYRDVKGIPEDAYRHVLWSYLLTMEYGPEFAEAITDAHEEGDNTNTEAEHRMDYNNNTIGREYADRQYKRNEILGHLLRDNRVIREAK